ncbi:2OG-Fe(II) oxygenase [Phenylobacterium sp.]|uniref:2OG-Fe(II) oxygenase n=1 Tax=Phenylobacterium sp. TaxID=1871053 RepID=UPI002DF45DCF|nr:2OG-Fe(II) oxygenase [Phenylobacterium sp.]
MPAEPRAEDVLQEQADAGDAQASYELGRRRLVGDRAAFRPEEGARRIAQAGDLGHPEAMALAATLAAAGVGRPQSWPEAFTLLQAAADRGHAGAARQLDLLTRVPGLDAWLSPPPRTPICEAPRVRTISGFLSPEVCRWVMDLAAPRLRPASRIDPASGREAPHPGRTNDLCVIDVLSADVIFVLVRARISAALDIPAACFEPTQILRYRVGQAFAPHFDFLDPGDLTTYDTGQVYDGQRIVTFLIYLNDGFEGGETAFPRAELKVRGAVGEAVYFANVDLDQKPDKASLHAGLPPTRGEKWVLSQWIHDRPFTGVGG